MYIVYVKKIKPPYSLTQLFMPKLILLLNLKIDKIIQI